MIVSGHIRIVQLDIRLIEEKQMQLQELKNINQFCLSSHEVLNK
jgi:hypothetical protein